MATRSRPKPEKNEAEATTGPFPLAEEVRTYEAQLPGWADREGQFVLIKGRDVLGFYPCHEEALEAGYDRLGGRPLPGQESPCSRADLSAWPHRPLMPHFTVTRRSARTDR
jgi:hypothetical protein